MAHFLGEFDCKLDAKGRMVIPSGLKKQLANVEKEGLVINRGFEKNLVLYTKSEWGARLEELNKLNQYEEKNRTFIRYFMRGATELVLDSASRVLLPKSLLEYAGIKGEVVLSCLFNKIEVWAADSYSALLDDAPVDFAKLAEEVMGGRKEGTNG